MKFTTDKTKVQAIPKFDIPHYAMVNLFRLGESHQEVVYMEHRPVQTIEKLTKDTYRVISTGEIKHFNHGAQGKQVDVIKKSMRRLEQLIKANFDTVRNADNALFVTLTYAEQTTDSKQVFKDFDRFMKRLRYEYKGHKLEYIVVLEPHESGAWHMHMLIKSDRPKLYIDNNESMNPIWGHGFTKTVRLKSDDVGCYYTAYFSNVEVPIGAADDPDPDAEYAFAEDEIQPGKSKRFKKGDRLRFYPKHVKFYRCSRGIVRPAPEAVKYSEVPKNFGTPSKAKSFSITKEAKKYNPDTVQLESVSLKLNTIQREYFKMSRPKKP